jgi:hypothetical protein
MKTVFESLSVHKRRTWLWIAVAVVLAIAAFVFHILSNLRKNIIYREESIVFDNEWYVCQQIILLAFAAVTLLLLAIACYSRLHIRKHPECLFKDVFSHTFHHYWVYYILFILLMTVISVVWTSMCCQAMDDHLFFFRIELKERLKNSVLISPPKEEAMWRLLPFLVAIIPMARVKAKRWRVALGCFFGLMILCVQMQFGYAHLSVEQVHFVDSTQRFLFLLKFHLFTQGGAGIIFSVTFGVVLFVASKTFLRRQVCPDVFKALLYAIPFAYLASTSVHLLNNLYILLSHIR